MVAALKGKSYWHFASHGDFDWNDARQSGLVMREKERLTIGRLLESQGSLGRPRLVVLSACETGLYDIERNPDEFVGLPATFMQAGAAGVVGSLWLVDDLATALLMARFYDLHMGARGPCAADGAAAGPGLAARQHQGGADGLRKAAAAKAKIDRTKLAELSGAADQGSALGSSRFAGDLGGAAGEGRAALGRETQKRKRTPAMKARPFPAPVFLGRARLHGAVIAAPPARPRVPLRVG